MPYNSHYWTSTICLHTVEWLVLFLTIQFSMSRTKFNSTKFNSTYQVVPLWARVKLGATTMKGHSTFPQRPQAEASPSDFLMLYLGHSLEEYYHSAEMPSVYSRAPVDWSKKNVAYSNLHPFRPNASLQRAKTLPLDNECPGYDTRLHLMMRLRLWSFGECGEPFYCHYSQVHSELVL